MVATFGGAGASKRIVSRLADIPIPEDLIARARRGDSEAQAAIYRALAPAVFALIRRPVGNTALAEDLFQETLMALFQRLGDFRGEAPLGAWLRQIAVARCLMYLRSPWHRARLQWDAGDETSAGCTLLPATPAMSTDALDVERALAALTPVGRAVVWGIRRTGGRARPAAAAALSAHQLIGAAAVRGDVGFDDPLNVARDPYMKMHIRLHTTLLTLYLAVAAGAAFAADGPATPAAAPPVPPEAAAMPHPPNIDEAVLQARLEAARRRLEVAAQQMAALSAQMSGPMMRRFGVLTGPRHAQIGVQLGRSQGAEGARVREVSPGGPAQRAGVLAGDLIVAVNGKTVRGPDPARQVIELLRGVRPGNTVDLRVLRHGTTRTLSVLAGPVRDGVFLSRDFPIAPPTPPLPPIEALAALGGAAEIIRGPVADMELARLTPALGRYFGTAKGVLVVRAPPHGALGLQDGDVILSIGGRMPVDSAHVIRILASYDPGEKITLEVLRLHRRIAVASTLPPVPAMARRVLMIRGADALGLHYHARRAAHRLHL